MNLDLPTLVVMGSFVSACAGAALLYTWAQNKKISTLAIWGLANLVNAAGILCLILGVREDPLCVSRCGRSSPAYSWCSHESDWLVEVRRIRS
jgi:hypothetical protein